MGFPSGHYANAALGFRGAVDGPPSIEFAVYQFVPINAQNIGSEETPQWDSERRAFGTYARRWVWCLRCQDEFAQSPIAAREFEDHYRVPLYLSSKGHSYLSSPASADTALARWVCSALTQVPLHDPENSPFRRGAPAFRPELEQNRLIRSTPEGVEMHADNKNFIAKFTHGWPRKMEPRTIQDLKEVQGLASEEFRTFCTPTPKFTTTSEGWTSGTTSGVLRGVPITAGSSSYHKGLQSIQAEHDEEIQAIARPNVRVSPIPISLRGPPPTWKEHIHLEARTNNRVNNNLVNSSRIRATEDARDETAGPQPTVSGTEPGGQRSWRITDGGPLLHQDAREATVEDQPMAISQNSAPHPIASGAKPAHTVTATPTTVGQVEFKAPPMKRSNSCNPILGVPQRHNWNAAMMTSATETPTGHAAARIEVKAPPTECMFQGDRERTDLIQRTSLFNSLLQNLEQDPWALSTSTSRPQPREERPRPSKGATHVRSD